MYFNLRQIFTYIIYIKYSAIFLIYNLNRPLIHYTTIIVKINLIAALIYALHVIVTLYHR